MVLAVSALIWDELSGDEAARLREEYRSELPKRLDRFLDSLPREVRSQVDQSFDSLDVVWQWWVGSHAPPDDIEDENVFLARDLPLWARSAHGLARKIGATNAHAVTDLAAYVASTITAQHPEAIWTTDPDLRSVNANQPLLLRDGHGMAFFPDVNVGTLCYRALIEPSDGRNPRDASALRRMVALLCGHNSDPDYRASGRAVSVGCRLPANAVTAPPNLPGASRRGPGSRQPRAGRRSTRTP